MNNPIDFYGHRPPATHRYRQRIIDRWIAWNPKLFLHDKGEAYEGFLPCQNVRNILKGSTLPIDVGCLTLISKTNKAICLLLPSGRGKTTIGCLAAKLSIKSYLDRLSRISASSAAPFRIFCSDMAWISVINEKLCVCRPQIERTILTWDIARMLARKEIGSRKFETERQRPLSQRTQTVIFKRLFLGQTFRGLSSNEMCFPQVLILGRLSEDTRKAGTDLLKSVLLAQGLHTSPFWHATPELQRRIHHIGDAIHTLPQTFTLNEMSPANSLKHIVSLTSAI